MDTPHLPPYGDPAARPELPPGAPLSSPSLEDRTMPPWESGPRRWAGWPVVGIVVVALGSVAALNYAVKHEAADQHAVVAATDQAHLPVIPPSDAPTETTPPAPQPIDKMNKADPVETPKLTTPTPAPPQTARPQRTMPAEPTPTPANPAQLQPAETPSPAVAPPAAPTEAPKDETQTSQ